MLHHFENGMALIKAAIIELHEKRLRAFRRAAETDQHDPATLVRTYWRQLQKPAFIAFHELALAARTDWQSGVAGKGGSVLVSLGGCRLLQKKKDKIY